MEPQNRDESVPSTLMLPSANSGEPPSLMSRSEQKILLAHNSKKFTELDHKQRILLLNRACIICGIREAPTVELAKVITADIANKFPSLKETELELAMNMNKYGELEKKFDHYQILSPDFVCNVLLEYYKHRNRLLMQFNKTDPYREKTDEEKKLLHDNFLEMICQKFEQYKKSGDVEIQLNKPVFDFLWNKCLMRFSKAKQDEYRARATEQHIKNMRENLLALNNQDVRNELRRFAEGGTLSDSSRANINWLCRMMAINDFFLECVKSGVGVRGRIGG